MKKILLLIIMCMQKAAPFYLYDRFNNKGLSSINYNDNNIFYTSNVFHSIEYNNKKINNTKTILLRNSTKQLSINNLP